MKVRLDAVCEITMGQAPSGDAYNDVGEGLPLLAGAGDFRGAIPNAKKFTRQVTKRCASGDLILGIRASIGDKVVADREYCLGRGVAGLRPRNGKLDQRYLWHWLSSIRPTLEAKAKGATFKQVNRKDIGELPLTLPSLSEQQRIATTLDQAEELRAKRRAAIALLDQLPQAIFLEMFGDPATNPKGWPMVSLEGVSQFIRNGKSIKQDKEAGGLPITRIETIANGHVNIAKCGYAGISEEDASGFLMEEGDLLFSHINSFEHVGKTAIYEGVPTLLVHGMNLLCIRPNQQVVRPLYILHHLRTSAFRRDLEPFINKAVNQASVSVTNLKAVKVPLPPIETQQLFAHRVEAIYHTRVAHQSALAELDALFASLQSSFFDSNMATTNRIR